VVSQFVGRLSGWVLLSGLVLGCSGRPDVSGRPNNGVATGGTAGSSGSAGKAGSGSGGSASQNGEGGEGNVPIVIGNGGDTGSECKTTCDADECGPIADGCGDIINCGGCQAPETCGGGGEPSKCGGSSACTPKTCSDLGAECGMQADGCGDVVNCWGNGGEECPNAGEQCVDGECTVPGGECTPLTCADYDANDGLCGEVPDGCGDTLDCDFSCAEDEICGAQEPGKCGTAMCEPVSCETALAMLPTGYCGFVPDGCGGEIMGCATACSNGDTCGGGGTPDVCGQGSGSCTPRTVADCGSTNCGPISDGCGDTVNCGTCTDPETCGGGGTPGQCGAPVCQPNSCNGFGFDCGSIPDGCGNTLNCGSCGNNEICNANVCEPVVCVPKTQAEACTGLCGQQSDGCGDVINCGGCTAPNTCGGGGTPSVCGSPPCTPLTCQDLGANCGPVGDGCGGIIPSCGTCMSPAICGGGGQPSVCGNSTGNNCTGLCQFQESCPTNSETRLVGTVRAPNGTEPLPNVLVYVPNAPLPAIGQGPSCDRCEDEDLGSPIAGAISAADGTFTLRNVPAGVSFPLVVKIGKWRRVVTIPAMTACSERTLTADESRLPKNMTDAAAGNVQYLNIPHMAIVTGSADAMECVVRKIGVSDSEFTLPSGNGRVHLYRANGAYASRTCTRFRSSGSCRDWAYNSAPLSDLFSNDKISEYDIAVMDCEGSANEHSDAYDDDLHAFAEAGGRVFASHYSYVYLHDNDDFATTATWGSSASADNTTGIVDTSTTKGSRFNTWLGVTGSHSATYGNGYIDIADPRYYVTGYNSTVSERFVYTDNVTVNGTLLDTRDSVQQYAFNTPVGATDANVCGRVLYSAFHVAVGSSTSSGYFPNHCGNSTTLTAQEKVLEYMLFDLSSCVSVGDPPGIPTCTPKTCTELGSTCGYRADGCGGLLDCGTCMAPETCGGGGTPNQCGSSCTRTTCGAQGANCGIIADGCGGTLTCGACTSPSVCGGGGTPNVCGVPTCTPRSCGSVDATCGAISDGCGGTVECGSCPSGQTCGGGGTPNQCGTGSCNPKTCTGENAECGFIGDGCGGTVSCGTCLSNETCGASGPNRCGGACAPRACTDVSANCGFVGDGCGGVLNCGVCQAPQVCGGGGVPSQCGGSCTPRTCAQAGAECGATSDGCGGVLQCGICPAGQTCGADGPNQCGQGSCMPRSCAAANAECGAVGDGCGNVLNCGTCMAPESCGGGGTPNQCGAGGCVPRTCAEQNAECGPAADGCGGLLDCGVCVAPESCGGGGIASQCGSVN
jgi:hypothetical protein